MHQPNPDTIFRMVDVLLREQAEEERDRRRSERRPYRCQQLLAPFDGRRLPAQSEFRLVRCQDLSTSGFCYIADRPPETRQVVIALGAVPFLFYTAEVQNVTPLDGDDAGSYRIGCRLLRRITRERPVAG